jgi:hypothetical protein
MRVASKAKHPTLMSFFSLFKDKKNHKMREFAVSPDFLIQGGVIVLGFF